MDRTLLKEMSFKDLKEVATGFDIKVKDGLNKAELITLIENILTEYENEFKEQCKRFGTDKYKILKQIGNKGKEGITYLVEDIKTGNYYAMKTFNKLKSSKRIEEEASLQERASKEGICPKVIEVNSECKYIVMELMDKHLLDILNEQNGLLTLKQQKQLSDIQKKLDKAKVFHGDSNILNYMLKGNQIQVIDFGMSKEIDTKLFKKTGSTNPNYELATLCIILKLKEFNYDPKSYSYLLSTVSEDNKIKFGLI